MISRIAISGYRSLRDVVIPLSGLTVIAGANGAGKSSTYRALRLMSDIADDRIIASIAAEGGFTNLLWAGPATISRSMRAGEVPVEPVLRKESVALKLGFKSEDFSYSIDMGMPPPNDRLAPAKYHSKFTTDPVIKRELLWQGPKPTPSRIIADRRGPSVQVKDGKDTHQFSTNLPGYESMVREVNGPRAPWAMDQLRRQLSSWRFYDQIRTDAAAPARQTQIGTRTLALSPDGRDLAAAIQTIYEIGDGEALDWAIDQAFPGARLDVIVNDGLFQIAMHQHGMLRPLGANELSDGTLRFVLLAAALLSPRPAPLLVLNEPESSLHTAVIPALGGLIAEVARVTQVVVVSHDQTLIQSLKHAGGELVELYKDTGETFAEGYEDLRWSWPKR